MKYKLLCCLVLSTVVCLAVNAQEEKEKGGWKSDHLYAGAGINLGFANGFIIGLNPEVGYSINKFMDVGIATNYTYVTQRSQFANASFRYRAIGAGPYLRIWPVNMIFIGSQVEFNAITYKEVLDGNTTYKENSSATSLLVGLGYGSRMIGQSQFFTSIMIDALNDENSPYRDQYDRVLPVFRTGFLFYFGRKGRGR
jgi:hypothetical protein